MMRLAALVVVLLVVAARAADADAEELFSEAFGNKDTLNFGQLADVGVKQASASNVVMQDMQNRIAADKAQADGKDVKLVGEGNWCDAAPLLAQNPPPAIVASGPQLNTAERALATSSMEPWRIGVLSAGCVLVAVGVLLLLLSTLALRKNHLANRDYMALTQGGDGVRPRPALGHVALLVLGIMSVLGGITMITLPLVLPVTAPVQPSGEATGTGVAARDFKPGQEVEFQDALAVSEAVARDPSGGATSWKLQFNDAKGVPVTVTLVAGLPQEKGPESKAEGQLPLTGSVISGKLRISNDGRAVLLKWRVIKSQAQTVAKVLCPGKKVEDQDGNTAIVPTRRLGVFVVSFAETNGVSTCGTQGARQACKPACSDGTAVQKMVADVTRFWSESTEGAISFRSASIHDVVFPSASYTDADGAGTAWTVLQAQPGFDPLWKDYNHRIFLFPGNLQRGPYFAPASPGGKGGEGYADILGPDTFVRTCNFRYVAHELGHNWGLGHNGAWLSSGGFNEYGDTAGLMGGFVGSDLHTGGPTVYNLFALGLLPKTKVLAIAKPGGDFTINSVTSHKAPLGAHLAVGNEQVWVEWREKQGFVDGALSTVHRRFQDATLATIDTLLVRRVATADSAGPPNTDLIAVLPKGKTFTYNGVTINHLGSGHFTVSY